MHIFLGSSIRAPITAREATRIVITTPCSLDVAVNDWVALKGGVAVKAFATSLDRLPCVGVVIEKPWPGEARIMSMGMKLTTGLIADAVYYVSATIAGTITDLPPGTPGTYQQKVAIALSPTNVWVAIDQTIKNV